MNLSELVEPLRPAVVWLMDVTAVPVLAYFVLINTSYLALIVLGGLDFRSYLRGRRTVVDTLGGELTPGVSVIVPAHNEEAGIVTSVKALLSLRYPGHVAIMRPIRELGLIGNDPITVKGQRVVPRDVFIAAVQPKLHKPKGRDLVALRVEVTGTKDGKPARAAFQLLDYYDAERGISAMMRTTGYSLSITGQMQADGRVTEKGVHTPDEAMPFAAYVAELAKRGVEIKEI